MSITQVIAPNQYTLFSDTNAGGTIDGIKNNTSRIYWISLDNTGNSGAVYVQLFNNASGNITVGTSPADFVMYVGGSSQETYNFPIPLAFPAGLSAAVTTTSGGSSSPSSPVILTIAYN